MSTPRRRLVRPAAVATATAQQRQRRGFVLRSRLARDREALTRSMSRLKRAFHSMENAYPQCLLCSDFATAFVTGVTG